MANKFVFELRLLHMPQDTICVLCPLQQPLAIGDSWMIWGVDVERGYQSSHQSIKPHTERNAARRFTIGHKCSISTYAFDYFPVNFQFFNLLKPLRFQPPNKMHSIEARNQMLFKSPCTISIYYSFLLALFKSVHWKGVKLGGIHFKHLI